MRELIKVLTRTKRLYWDVVYKTWEAMSMKFGYLRDLVNVINCAKRRSVFNEQTSWTSQSSQKKNFTVQQCDLCLRASLALSTGITFDTCRTNDILRKCRFDIHVGAIDCRPWHNAKAHKPLAKSSDLAITVTSYVLKSLYTGIASENVVGNERFFFTPARCQDQRQSPCSLNWSRRTNKILSADVESHVNCRRQSHWWKSFKNKVIQVYFRYACMCRALNCLQVIDLTKLWHTSAATAMHDRSPN